MKKRKIKQKRSNTRLIAVGFALLILTGAMLLTLPIAVRDGQPNFLESLFTATSAACVTGLAVVDTYQNWTLFGQIIIICLIQIGGLGFMTIGAYIAILLKKRIGLKQRETLHESVNSMELAGVVRLTKHIIQGTVLFEGVGAILLAIRFVPEFGPVKGIYYSIFHAISAFCNAGFDLMGTKEAYSSFVSYEGDVLVNVTLMTLIVIGGIGFVVWDDVRRNKLHFHKYLLHTKIVLLTTFLITIVSTILFLIIENQNTFAGMTVTEKLCGAFFSSITPRTAGFNTVDTAALSNGSKLLTMALMFIGGSPGSTAGGVKTTTLVVLILYAVATVRNEEDINLFGRRLTEDAVKKANAVVIINLSLALCVAFLIMATQTFQFDEVMFEVLSAIGTTGMTEGITRDLNTVSRLGIIFLMYCGRLGSLSFALAFARNRTTNLVRQPQEKIIVG